MIYFQLDYLKTKALGGVMVWSLDTDDFNGVCYTEKFPLITTIKNHLHSKSSAHDDFRIISINIENEFILWL